MLLDIHASHVALVEDLGGDKPTDDRADDAQEDGPDDALASPYHQVCEKPRDGAAERSS